MKRKDALVYIFNMDYVRKPVLIEKIGQKYFEEFLALGFIATGSVGSLYWLTDNGRVYCLEMFS